VEAGLTFFEEPVKGTKNPDFRAKLESLIKEKYPSEGPNNIAAEVGLSREAVIIRAKRLGVKQDRKALFKRISETRTELYDTLNLALWRPTLTPVGAYYLGLLWADGTVSYETPDTAKDRESHYNVVLTLTGDEQELVYDFARRLHLTEDRVRPHRKYEEHHKDGKTLKLSGKRITSMLIDHFGIYPRKSYSDPEFPKNIPDNLLSSFTRGVSLDGDGSGNLYEYNSPTPVYVINGSPKFINELWKRVKIQVPSLTREPYKISGESIWAFGVHGPDKVPEFTRWLHNEEPGYPFARRKHEPFLQFLLNR
jgi:hypothetical protein